MSWKKGEKIGSEILQQRVLREMKWSFTTRPTLSCTCAKSLFQRFLWYVREYHNKLHDESVVIKSSSKSRSTNSRVGEKKTAFNIQKAPNRFMHLQVYLLLVRSKEFLMTWEDAWEIELMTASGYGPIERNKANICPTFHFMSYNRSMTGL